MGNSAALRLPTTMSVWGCLGINTLRSILGEQWTADLVARSPTVTGHHSSSLPPTIMAENSRLLRTLRLISETSRKFHNITPTTHATPTTPTILRSLPRHKPLLPLLLSHGIPSKLAQVCADRYDRYATQLRSETETRLSPYLAHHRRDPPPSVYPVFLENYNQTLRDWAQSVLNATLKRLERDSTDIRNWDVTYPPPFWLPMVSPAHRSCQTGTHVSSDATGPTININKRGSTGEAQIFVPRPPR